MCGSPNLWGLCTVLYYCVIYGVSAKSVGSKLCTILVLCVGGCVSIRLCCESV